MERVVVFVLDPVFSEQETSGNCSCFLQLSVFSDGFPSSSEVGLLQTMHKAERERERESQTHTQKDRE